MRVGTTSPERFYRNACLSLFYLPFRSHRMHSNVTFQPELRTFGARRAFVSDANARPAEGASVCALTSVPLPRCRILHII